MVRDAAIAYPGAVGACGFKGTQEERAHLRAHATRAPPLLINSLTSRCCRLTYWIIFSASSLADPLLDWVPFYFAIKVHSEDLRIRWRGLRPYH